MLPCNRWAATFPFAITPAISRVHSVAGDIEVIRPSGNVEASSITGNLHFVSPATTKLHGSTTSGRILYEGDFMGRGDYILSAYSGDVDIVCPAFRFLRVERQDLEGQSDQHHAHDPPAGVSFAFGSIE